MPEEPGMYWTRTLQGEKAGIVEVCAGSEDMGGGFFSPAFLKREDGKIVSGTSWGGMWWTVAVPPCPSLDTEEIALPWQKCVLPGPLEAAVHGVVSMNVSGKSIGPTMSLTKEESFAVHLAQSESKESDLYIYPVSTKDDRYRLGILMKLPSGRFSETSFVINERSSGPFIEAMHEKFFNR